MHPFFPAFSAQFCLERDLVIEISDSEIFPTKSTLMIKTRSYAYRIVHTSYFDVFAAINFFCVHYNVTLFESYHIDISNRWHRTSCTGRCKLHSVVTFKNGFRPYFKRWKESWGYYIRRGIKTSTNWHLSSSDD